MVLIMPLVPLSKVPYQMIYTWAVPDRTEPPQYWIWFPVSNCTEDALFGPAARMTSPMPSRRGRKLTIFSCAAARGAAIPAATDNPKSSLHRAAAWNDFSTLPPLLRFLRDNIIDARGIINEFRQNLSNLAGDRCVKIQCFPCRGASTVASR